MARSCLTLHLLPLALATALTAPAHAATRRPGLDVSAATPAAPAVTARLEALRADPALSRVGTVMHIDERFGVPTLVQGIEGDASVARGVSPVDAARGYLRRLAPYYRLESADVDSASLRFVHDTGQGGIIAAFDQVIDGVPVFRDEVKVFMSRSLGLLAVSGNVPGRAEAGPPSARQFRTGPDEAIATAAGDMAGASVAPSAVHALGSGDGGYQTFTLSSPAAPAGLAASKPIRARRVLFHVAGALVPAYYVELMADDDAMAYVVAADSARVLMRHSLMANDIFNYRVWGDNTSLHQPYDGPEGTAPSPHPTGAPNLYTPPFVPPLLLSLPNGPIVTNDPWLPPGATTTSGNNVDAYADLVAPDGYSAGDVRATITSANTFDRTYDATKQPNASVAQQMASITQLFYTNNFLHDWFYSAGFTEATGNAQLSNYGRGGLGNDPILAEAQDYSGINNANMSTPADGASPREQMYVFTPSPTSETVAVNSPASVAGVKADTPASGNPLVASFTAAVAMPTLGTFNVVNKLTMQFSNGPEWVDVNDLNGDGHNDISSANYGNNTVSVYYGDGTGGFPTAGFYATGAGPYMVITPDLNHDGKPDLVTANFTAGTVSVRLDSAGVFKSTKTDFPAGANPASVAVGHFNNDAHNDLVVADWGGNAVAVLYGDGAGGVATTTSYPMGANPNWVATADFNGDGYADIVTANAGSNTISVRLGLAVGGFGPRTDYLCGNGPLTLAIGDVNGDGKLDVVTANNTDNTVAVLLGDGAGGFGAPSAIPVPGTPITVALGDLSGDGLMDIVVCSDAANSVSVLYGTGGGAFTAPVSFATGASPYAVAIADLNGDKYPDLVTADYLGNSVSVLAGDVGPPLPTCPPFTNQLANRIALIFGGSCADSSKIKSAAATGAVAALIVDNTTGSLAPGFVSPIPAFRISNVDGNAIRGALRTGVGVNVTVTMPSAMRDGALDADIVAHEWGHHMSNRLIGNASGLFNSQGEGMGEGWSDFVALLLKVRPEDAGAPANSNWSGVYTEGSYSFSSSTVPNDAYYYGGRRYPYCTDITKNPLTFTMIQQASSLPPGPPENPMSAIYSDDNSEVHNVGEVWCETLWECYAALLRDSGRLTFTQARDRMRSYLVTSLMLTPIAPTMLEARDAMLLAALGNDPADYALFCAAFAKRGMGVGAVCPSRFAQGNNGVTESFKTGGDLVPVSASLVDNLHSCDSDGYLDSGEDATFSVTLSNPLGSTSLSATTATVSSTNPNVTFPAGNAINFPASQPHGTTIGTVRVRLAGSGIQTVDLKVAYNDPGFATAGPRNYVTSYWGNVDETSSSTESFEAQTTAPWTPGGALASSFTTPWARTVWTTSPLNHAYFIADPIGESDQWLTSPPLNVGAGSFSFSFDQAFKFDGQYPYLDGGVVEITSDNGAHWNDIGASLTPAYNGTIPTGYGNPLGGRAAYVVQTVGYPNGVVTTTASLGTTYASKTVQVRFRLGTDDYYIDGQGWMIDNVVFNGLTNAPFKALVADASPCTPLAVDDTPPLELAFAVASANPSLGDPAFRFALPQAARVTIAIYDVAGRRVTTVADGEFAAGIHAARWSTGTHGPGPGVYFARMVAGSRTLDRRVVILAR